MFVSSSLAYIFQSHTLFKLKTARGNDTHTSSDTQTPETEPDPSTNDLTDLAPEAAKVDEIASAPGNAEAGSDGADHTSEPNSTHEHATPTASVNAQSINGEANHSRLNPAAEATDPTPDGSVSSARLVSGAVALNGQLQALDGSGVFKPQEVAAADIVPGVAKVADDTVAHLKNLLNFKNEEKDVYSIKNVPVSAVWLRVGSYLVNSTTQKAILGHWQSHLQSDNQRTSSTALQMQPKFMQDAYQ
ncbi:hypothetical protein FRC00_002639 [Tulasnella sp. 408]|nr:hypothetical protein FRC00_002639 [Tulasnella sp. 408]